ncbi:hypothetical protein G7Y89_g11106 [Cudoniella acicularis]|uniref:Alternative oxidase n=1 Tax=Cudoniella acicularis TaxID=354080 RepID=A0A8H4RCY7_9HELO|nr:hypothetical protein G7Y89_g11106 [Cudoniella acicularis]
MALQLPPGVNRRYAALAAIALGAIWLWVAFDRPYKFPDHIAWNIYSNRPLSGQTTEVRDVFDFPPLESESIKSICGETQWNQSVVFTCDKSVGGIGNLRNSILNCVRYAISAGASLVVPSIVLRNTSDISQIRTGVETDMSYMFDTQHFLDSIRLSCPSLQIHSSINDIKDFENAHEVISLLPESLVEHVPATGLPEPEAWRSQFYTWLEQYSTPEVTGPMIINLGRSYLQYPIYSDAKLFALSFGSILKFRSDVRVLAVKTLQSLADTYFLTLDLTQDILPNAFFGAHLRTEKDAVEGWPAPDWIYSRFETQSRVYLEQAPRSSSSVIYVASGDLNEVAKFAHNASTSPNNYSVTTKFDLLKGKDLEELQALKWDQQALVDFLVMLKASDFAGIGHSSFAWNVALKRHVLATNKKHLDGPQMLSDELSQIYGNIRGYPEYAACLWP